MELTQEEKQIVVNLLQQISIPVNQAPIVLAIIEKLKIKEDRLTKQKSVV